MYQNLCMYMYISCIFKHSDNQDYNSEYCKPPNSCVPFSHLLILIVKINLCNIQNSIEITGTVHCVAQSAVSETLLNLMGTNILGSTVPHVNNIQGHLLFLQGCLYKV
jgi:hypothetical protein